METNDPNEKAEARAVAIWLARGVGLSVVGGVLWAWPIGHEWLRILAVAAAVIFAVIAVSLASLAATVTRNIVGRYFQLQSHPRMVFGMGLAIFACYVAFFSGFFLLGTAPFSPGT